MIGKVVFNSENPKAQLFYDILKKYPQSVSFGVGYIENTRTGETELIEVSMYMKHGEDKNARKE